MRRPLCLPLAPIVGWFVAAVGLILTGLAADLRADAAEVEGIDIPAQPQAILPLDEVRIGMKGYGLSVFHGAEVEAFPVEVVSVMQDFGPNRGAIWIRCPDERMQRSGPVQGMSGSPIYLWPETDDAATRAERVSGEGGKLIGAFAFGFPLGKDCYVGVQPIELMRKVGERAALPGEQARGGGSGDPAVSVALIRQLQAMADQRGGVSPASRSRLQQLARVTQAWSGDAASAENRTSPPPAPASFGGQGKAQRLMLPVTLGNPELAELVRPLMREAGLMPLSVPAGTAVGRPPELDPEAIRVEPGSVFSVPLVYGDMDMAAAGTVTDVLPDGRVLGFGHAMFGQGASALPFASGYVHYVQPSLQTSFKLSGSGAIRGTLVRDEMAAVTARPQSGFETAEVAVNLRLFDQDPLRYRYQVARHPQLTPMLAAITAVRSVMAQQNLPTLNTVLLETQMSFDGGRSLSYRQMIPNATPFDLLLQIAPVISILANNPHESLMLRSLNVEAQVVQEVRSGVITNASLDRAEVAPGERVGVTVDIQPFGGPLIRKRARIEVPPDMPAGQHGLLVADTNTHAQMVIGSKPHLLMTRTVDDLVRLIDRILGQPTDSLFLMLQRPQQGISVGREELPGLPSSRRVMLQTPLSTRTSTYAEWASERVELGRLVTGATGFTLSVREPGGAAAASGGDTSGP